MTPEIREIFVNQVQKITREWTEDVALGREPVHKYSDQIFHIHQIMKEIIKLENDTKK